MRPGRSTERSVLGAESAADIERQAQTVAHLDTIDCLAYFDHFPKILVAEDASGFHVGAAFVHVQVACRPSDMVWAVYRMRACLTMTSCCVVMVSISTSAAAVDAIGACRSSYADTAPRASSINSNLTATV